MKKNVYSVSRINSYIRNMFSTDYMLSSVSVKGEISNLKYHSSGHIYFSLKDEGALLACVMFASAAGGLTFRLSEGMSVIASGKIEVYERDGKYQLYAARIEEDGQGDLNLAFLKLKERLSEMGLFSPEYKQPIPPYASRVGIVTAPTGAAVRDIIQISKRRNPFVQLILYPAAVQGEGAAESIVRGIKALDAYGVDVIIAGRGGGSMEDLWAFNEEAVAQAIFDCATPIISAVGHETDTTIADFVADMRAPTPSAAAELAVADVSAVLDKLDGSGQRMIRCMRRKLAERRQALMLYEKRLGLASPEGRLRSMRQRAAADSDKLEASFGRVLKDKKHRYELLLAAYRAHSPLDRLGGGYVYATDAQGAAIGSIEAVALGDEISLRFKDGRVGATISCKEAL